MTSIRALLSFNIKKKRQILGISQVNLAEKVGTSTQYIGQIEQNKKFPSPEMLERIAEALEVDSPQLFSMEAFSQAAIQQFKDNLKVNLEKAIDDYIDKGLTEVKIVGVNASPDPASQDIAGLEEDSATAKLAKETPKE